MSNQSIHWSIIISALYIFLCPFNRVSGQQRLDLGVVLAPEFNRVQSIAQPSGLERGRTYGGQGLSLGFVAGAYLEYEVLSGLYLRGGLNYARQRYSYDVRRDPGQVGEPNEGKNRVVYTAIELPVAVLYRFHYSANNDRFLFGVGGVLDRWLGDPQVDAVFVPGSLDRSYIQEAYRSVQAFVGYDHYVSDRFVLGIEPYVSYSPTRFQFETESTGKNTLQGGIALRIRFDN